MKLATLCYIRNKDKTLMLHRIKKENDIHEGKWNGLGGKFEPGETPEECVIREVKEESGLNIISPILKGVLTFPEFSKGEDWYVFLFVADKFTGELIESNEGHLEWIDNKMIKDLPLWEGDHLFLDWLEQDRFFSAKFVYRDDQLTGHRVTFY
ncbi:MAG: NUDIX domain-containing protein [Calditrichaceae bacterium]